MSSIRHIWIPVSDIDRSVDFYTQQLGLAAKLVLHRGEKTGDKEVQDALAQLETKDKNVLVMLVEKPEAFPVHGGAVIGFTVNDLDTVKLELEKKGVVFVGNVIELDDRRFIHFSDPDGHVFQLGELKSHL